MTPDDWDVSDNPHSPEDDEPRGSQDKAHDSFGTSREPLPPQLQNWRVVEIEGTVTPREESRRQTSQSVYDDPTTNSDAEDAHPSVEGGGDRIDEFVVLSVPDRHVDVAPGVSGTFTLSLLNNTDRPVVLQVAVSGDGLPTWFPELPMRVPLQPGERQSFVVMVAPPPGSEAPAGEYGFYVIAQQIDRGERYSRVACTLSIQRQTSFRLGMLQPDRVITSWWSPSARTMLPIANLGNHEMSFRVLGGDADRECLFEFDSPHGMYAQVGQASFTLGPGAREAVGVTILSKRRPVVGLFAQERSFRIAVEMTGTADQPSRQVADGTVLSKALIGPWQVAALAGVTAAVLLVIMLSSAAMLLALRPAEAPPEVVLPTPPPAPAFALVLSMEEPVPTREPAPVIAAPPAEQVTDEQASSTVAAPQEQGGLPVVQHDQVSAPGGMSAEVPVASSSERPTPVAVAPVDPSNMTYAQMFRQIGSRYDLNWRMLAAQGYVESGFDSTAVGRQGSLGIMQIHPDTWQEWAPHVDAADPFDTYSNVLVAALYLDYLRATLGKAGHPQVEWMLAAYNWGPDKVLGLLADGGSWTDLPVEVQQYAADVLRIAQSIPGT